MKPRPNAGVLAWLAEVDEDSVFLSVVTITELRYGIERLATGRRRDHLDRWLRKDLTSRFGQRILPVDFEIADTCGRLLARSESVGRPIEPRDPFISPPPYITRLTPPTPHGPVIHASGNTIP